ncbi:hypothetical protein ACKWTF_015546 [Chironomus riparius]
MIAMTTQSTIQYDTSSLSQEQLDIYKSYAMYSAYQHQTQLGYYSSVPAYQQLSFIASPNQPSPSSSSTKSTTNSSKEFKLTCEHCGSVYTSQKRLQNHYEKCIVLNPHLDEVIVCKVCKRTFRTNPGYANHLVKFHGETMNENEDVKRLRKRARSHDDIEEVRKEKKSIFHSIELLARSDSVC